MAAGWGSKYKVFHQKASNRWRKNDLQGLFDANGNWCTSVGNIKPVVVDYFSYMFKYNGELPSDLVLESVLTRVTPDMNRILCADYFDIEIKEALFQMDPHMALGPNGLSLLFYQKMDVTAAVKSFFPSGCILNQLNYTTVSLIPKVPEPTNMTYFALYRFAMFYTR